MKRIFGIILILMVMASDGILAQTQKPVVVKITTGYGNILLKLYDETPLHRDNFKKLICDGVFSDLLFHRVISGFMIQGGDPESKNAAPGARLGGGSLGYMVPAEFNPTLFHKKGALAAARTGGPTNPEKKSSASQFYIVQGKVFVESELDTILAHKNLQLRNEVMAKMAQLYQNQFQQLKTENDQTGINKLIEQIKSKADSVYKTIPKYSFSTAQRMAYTTVGGAPHLDGDYTVFGEVIDGLDVVDKIAAVERDQFDRPLVDVKFSISIVN